MGKLSTRDLGKLLSCIRKDETVVVSPLPGYDSGVHLIGDKYMVVSTDPCIGVPQEWFGWLLIHFTASDVALFGARPEYGAINLLGPPSTKPETFFKIMKQACQAAEELKMTLMTGHTGTYEGLSTMVGVCTAYGVISKDRLITPGGARAGDRILCTKPLGLEVAINFVLTHQALARELFGARRTRQLAKQINLQSCVKEAFLLAETGGVHAMHDATEGGLTAALNEMAEASRVGFRIGMEEIHIPREVHVLQERFDLGEDELLSMSSSGMILAAVSKEAEDNVKRTLRQSGVESSFVGVFREDKRRVMINNGKEMPFPKKANDPYGRILSAKS